MKKNIVVILFLLCQYVSGFAQVASDTLIAFRTVQGSNGTMTKAQMVSGFVSGSGTANNIVMFTGANTIGNGPISLSSNLLSTNLGTSLKVNGTNSGYNPALWVSDANSTLGGVMYFEWRGGATNNKVHSFIADSYGLGFYRMTDGGAAFVSTIPDLNIRPNGYVGVFNATAEERLHVIGKIQVNALKISAPTLLSSLNNGMWISYINSAGEAQLTDILLANDDAGISFRNAPTTSFSRIGGDIVAKISGTERFRIGASGIEAATIKLTSGASANTWMKGDASGNGTWAFITKSDVGLSNVDNTSDVNKPVSTATQTALNAKENTIAAGTTSQYWRGDKTWQTFPTIPAAQVNSDWNATSGVAQILNKPTIPNDTNLGNTDFSITGNRVISNASGHSLNFTGSGLVNFGSPTSGAKVAISNTVAGRTALNVEGVSTGVAFRVDNVGGGKNISFTNSFEFQSANGANVIATVDNATGLVMNNKKVTGIPTTGATGSDAISVTQADATYEKKLLGGSVNITQTMNNNTSYSTTITVTGAAVGDVCIHEFQSADVLINFTTKAMVTSANTVTVYLANSSGVTQAFTSVPFKVKVFK